jgi:glycosyltransferase involved in cell wall biosynthesis
MSRALISLVLPVYNEGENIVECLRRIERGLAGHAHEILVCYDLDQDTTLPAIAAMTDRPKGVRLVKNTLGRGAPRAMRAGFQAAQGDVIVTTMADLSDPPELVPRMAELVRAGADVVSGSRYMRGGSQQGGPLVKRTLSRAAGLLLYWICGLRTHDPTNNFRAYSPRFLSGVEVESSRGFEIALELTVKAHLAGARVTEIPSSWVDRSAGKSNFKLWKWMPNYLRWFARAILAPVLALLVWGSPGGASVTAVYGMACGCLRRSRSACWCWRASCAAATRAGTCCSRRSGSCLRRG